MMVFDITNGSYVPFKTILNYLSGEPTWNIAIRNIVGNIILFVPLGFFLQFFCRSITWKFVLLATFIISVVIEITQGIFRVGIFDIDDILLNVFGAIIGYGIYVCLKLIFRKS
jgi:glycopeptide antibiotics resistance protein